MKHRFLLGLINKWTCKISKRGKVTQLLEDVNGIEEFLAFVNGMEIGVELEAIINQKSDLF